MQAIAEHSLPLSDSSSHGRLAAGARALCLALLIGFALSTGTGCAALDATQPVDPDRVAPLAPESLEPPADLDEGPSDLDRWSRLSKEGREHLLFGRTAEAEETLLEALAVSKQFRASDVRLRVSFRNLERVAKQYEEEDADAGARRVLAIIAIETTGLSDVDYPGLSDRLVDLGRLEELQGDLEAAARAYRRALDLRSDKSGANSPTLVEVLLQLSALEVARERSSRAVELADRALVLARTHVGENSGEHIKALLNAAGARRSAGELEEAEAQYDEALRLQRALEASTYAEAALLNGLAFVYLDTSRLSEARATVDDALAILDLLAVDGLERALVLDTKAQILAAQGSTGQAEDLYDEVMLHVDAAPPTTRRELFESYEDFLIDQNRLGEARRIRDRIETLAAPAPESAIGGEDGSSEKADSRETTPLAEVSAESAAAGLGD